MKWADTIDELGPAQRLLLTCVRVGCPEVGLGCQRTPPECPEYGAPEDANAVYTGRTASRPILCPDIERRPDYGALFAGGVILANLSYLGWHVLAAIVEGRLPLR